jgi:hypothetical protein
MRWVFIMAKGSTIEKIKIFDDYFVGEVYANEYLRIGFGVNEVDFPEYRKGECYQIQCSDGGISVGLYKDNFQPAFALV